MRNAVVGVDSESGADDKFVLHGKRRHGRYACQVLRWCPKPRFITTKHRIYTAVDEHNRIDRLNLNDRRIGFAQRSHSGLFKRIDSNFLFPVILKPAAKMKFREVIQSVARVSGHT